MLALLALPSFPGLTIYLDAAESLHRIETPITGTLQNVSLVPDDSVNLMSLATFLLGR